MQFIHGFFADFLQEESLIEKNKLLFTKNAQKYFNEEVKSNDEKLLSSPLIYYFNYKIEKYQLAYEVHLEAKSSFRAENVYISALNGEFLGSESTICNINFPGTAQTQYNGTQNITTDATNLGGPFILRETRGPNNVIIHTRNNNFGGLEVNGATDLSDNDNNWTFAEYGNLRAGFDAHWGAETVFDYWNTVHQRNSINNAGLQINSYFNVNVGTNPVNAFWNNNNNNMYYGNGISGGNVTTLDVCAHEFGHGIDKFTGNLAYEKESGALDEGFADIWGACVEAWRTPQKQRWLIGEDLNIGAIRNMSNPNMFNQPDTYLGNFWLIQMAVLQLVDKMEMIFVEYILIVEY
ncbi:M4 family metallopeptidase [Pedobacter alpinus]|uniref:Neutral metalloproteinase n=1 Tax=Pedobacter alpinus TaxID=1590643 RepID=A0ABW5TSD7_9SPHI